LAVKVKLQVTGGPIKGRRFEFDTHDTFLFGRGKDCHARLPKDGYVSRHHFILEVNPPEATVRDLGSLNGTHVNGIRYGGRTPAKGAATEGPPQAPLKHGDLITVGNTTIEFLVVVPSGERHGSEAARNDGPTAPPVQLRQLIRTEPQVPPRPATASEVVAEEPSVGPPPAEPADGPGRTDPPPPAAIPVEEERGLRHLIRQAAHEYQEGKKIHIDGYDLGAVLGQGGMGIVYQAKRLVDDFPVAIKVMAPKGAVDEKARRRFLREIDVVRSLDHPSIVTLLAMGALGNSFFFVMDYCSGGSLAEYASRQGGKLQLAVLGPMMLGCLGGLAHAHDRGFVHRDLKPANILLHQLDRGWMAKISDFGLAKHFEQAGFSGMTLTGSFGGTYDYMPREQLTEFKTVKPVSDVWSITATFYRMLTGQSPRPCAEGRDPMEVVLRDGCVPIREREPSVPPRLAALIDQALDVKPSNRFQTAGEMLAAFQEVL
jgi:tRNA A-37 threonylcarbamoyl transferase component Bud32